MRTLFLTRGIPGCGKSTFIKEHNLDQYKICADEIRLLNQAPIMNIDGSIGISQSNDSAVWSFLFELLRKRMYRGEFLIVDATNIKTSDINKYKKLCDEYRYILYVIDFSDIPIHICKERNLKREDYKIVPEKIIDKMYERLKSNKIPSGVRVIKPLDFKSTITNLYSEIDLSAYKKIHHIGDLHGCNTVLQEYLKDGLNDDEFYIFLGDYTDRGIENVEVLEFLLTIYDKSNVILLTGNHEYHVTNYLNNNQATSIAFKDHTKMEIENSNIDKKDLKRMYKTMRQMAYYRYEEKIVLVTHGGISNIIKPLVYLPTEQFIKGVGKYSDMMSVNTHFLKNTPSNYYQIHGHRNIQGVDIQVNDRCFNLCDEVEFGGFLRILTLDQYGFIPIKIKNNVFKITDIDIIKNTTLENVNPSDIVSVLRKNKYVIEKPQGGNISSFNFSRDAFNEGIWNDITIKTRGLYINTNTNEVVARGYSKFFNADERESTEFNSLKNNLCFPVKAWLKYNGFLGLVGYDTASDSLIITTKSAIHGDYAKRFKEILQELNIDMTKLKSTVKNNNLSLVFEVIDKDKDPHMIEYDENSVVLLDAFYRDIRDIKITDNELCKIARNLKVEVKELCHTFSNFNEFSEWYSTVTQDDYQHDNNYIEGFVLEDSNGFTFKLKLQYYKLWKRMRRLKDIVKSGKANKKDFGTIIENKFYEFLLDLKDNNTELLNEDIITLRKYFFANYY